MNWGYQRLGPLVYPYQSTTQLPLRCEVTAAPEPPIGIYHKRLPGLPTPPSHQTPYIISPSTHSTTDSHEIRSHMFQCSTHDAIKLEKLLNTCRSPPRPTRQFWHRGNFATLYISIRCMTSRGTISIYSLCIYAWVRSCIHISSRLEDNPCEEHGRSRSRAHSAQIKRWTLPPGCTWQQTIVQRLELQTRASFLRFVIHPWPVSHRPSFWLHSARLLHLRVLGPVKWPSDLLRFFRSVVCDLQGLGCWGIDFCFFDSYQILFVQRWVRLISIGFFS